MTTKTVKELREIAKELNITGVWNMKKDELISAIEEVQQATINEEIIEEVIETPEVIEEINEEIIEAQETETVSEEEVKPSKPRKPKKDQRAVYLLNPENEIIEEFESQSEAIRFCMKEKYCNAGWAGCSLNSGRAFYQREDGTMTTPKKNHGYHGVGFRLVYKIN